jgi:hypothetical protein
VTSTIAAPTSSKPRPSITLLPLPLSTPATAHNDLESFLKYSSDVNLPKTTTTFMGTHYEYTVLASLRRLGFDLIRTGGRADKGIDLLGHWYLPGLPEDWPLRILVQCKALKKKAGPNIIRELEGAIVGARSVRWRDSEENDRVKIKKEDDEEDNEEKSTSIEAMSGRRSGRNIMSLLATPQEATKGVREAMSRSRLPMGYLKIGLNGSVEQLLWNRTAASQGLEGVSVVQRHVPKEVETEDELQTSTTLNMDDDTDTSEDEDTVPSKPKVMEQQIVLILKGQPWENILH